MAPMKGSKSKVRLDDKIVVITGANTGIGRETALDLSRRGARIVMLCRDVEKARKTCEEIAKETKGKVDVIKLDLASLASVRACAQEVNQTVDRIDILINNAGVMMCPDWKTEDGFEMQFGTNHLGHFLLTELLLPLVKKSAETGFHPRIVIVSSLAHEWGKMYWDDLDFKKRGYNSLDAYNQSKLANVLHGKELARRLKGTNISVYTLHPGAVDTELARHVGKKWYAKVTMPFIKLGMKTPLQGAQTTLYCVLDPKIEKDSGNYYSDCKEKQAAKRARKEENQKKLWEISEKLVGIKSG